MSVQQRMYRSFSGASFVPLGMCRFERVSVTVVVAIVEADEGGEINGG
jgi:hypothetical protein